jgi:steroid 5-alpha reductase family enzyme
MWPEFWQLLATGTALVVGLMTGLWLLGIRYRNFSYVDLKLKFFVFFQLQALLNAFLSLPLLLACLNPAATIHWLEWLGLAV